MGYSGLRLCCLEYYKELGIWTFVRFLLFTNQNFSIIELPIWSKHFTILFRSALFLNLCLVLMFFMPNLAYTFVLWALLKMLHTLRLYSQRYGRRWHHWQLGLFGYFMYRYLCYSQMSINEKQDHQNFLPVIPLYSLKRFSQASAKNFGTHFLKFFFFAFINHSFHVSEMHIRNLFKHSKTKIFPKI